MCCAPSFWHALTVDATLLTASRLAYHIRDITPLNAPCLARLPSHPSPGTFYLPLVETTPVWDMVRRDSVQINSRFGRYLMPHCAHLLRTPRACCLLRAYFCAATLTAARRLYFLMLPATSRCAMDLDSYTLRCHFLRVTLA